ncbi:MAG: DUF6049 family protein [Acidimicrobiales bacterium]|nr:DUF6049 family protein [Acidimicrobiales bacterium]
MSRPLRRAVATFAVALAVGIASAPEAPGQERADVEVVLVGQTATVEAGGTFDLEVTVAGAPTGADLRVVVHDRIRSRSELTTSEEGRSLRRTLHEEERDLAALPAGEGGVRRIGISLDPAEGARPALDAPGVYPTELLVQDDDGRALDGVITHLLVRPSAEGGSPPLAVAVVARIDAPPTPSAGVVPLDAEELADAAALLEPLVAGPHLATLAATPDTLEALSEAPSEGSRSLLEQLRLAAARQPVLALPYVAVSPDGLATAGMADALSDHLERGRAVQQRILEAEPTEAAWLAAPDLGGRGLSLLDAAGIERVVVDPEQLDSSSDGLLSLARPFLVAPPRSRASSETSDAEAAPTEGFVQDARVAEALRADGSPALVASRVLAELTMLWLEQPNTARAVIVPIGRGTDPSAATRILEGLQMPTLFRTVPLDDVFREATPITDGGGDRVARTLRPGAAATLTGADAARLRELRARRESVRSMVGEGSPMLDPIDAGLLRATGSGLGTEARDVQLDRTSDAIDQVAGAITAQDRFTITLTAREGTVPLTIGNDSGETVDVRVRLVGPKLELPDGDTIDLRLTAAVTRHEIAVRTRASGAIPLEVEVLSPDGGLVLATSRYSVRSTAVSGVGLVLSAGAGLFLVVWWARHWRQTRRSAKLVASPHPVARSLRER